MTFEEFKHSLDSNHLPAGLTEELKALWFDGKDDWHAAHEIAQEITGRNGSWIHAYLHRKEGDRANAQYWYHRASKPYPASTLSKEWEELVKNFLN